MSWSSGESGPKKSLAPWFEIPGEAEVKKKFEVEIRVEVGLRNKRKV